MSENSTSPRPEAGRFREDLAGRMVEAGVPRMPARAFVHLLASDHGRLTAAELATGLRASPAAVSGAVRFLEQLRLVEREREPGSRRDHYAVRDDAWHAATVRKDELLELWIKHLDDGIAELGPDSPAGRRLAVSRAFFAFVLREMPDLLVRWEQEKATLFPSPLP